MAQRRSLEVRWIREGGLPGEVATWFDALGGPLDPRRRVRVDAYWLGEEPEAHSVKVRSVGDEPPPPHPARAEVEIKVLERRLGHVRLAPRLEGTAELWRKFRLPPGTRGDDVGVDPGRWVRVRKRRVRKRWPTSPRRTTASLELTEVETEGCLAWSVAIQARGPAAADELREALRDAAVSVFATWPPSVRLGRPESGSFAAWLHRRAAGRDAPPGEVAPPAPGPPSGPGTPPASLT